jgi:hypothetical protein
MCQNISKADTPPFEKSLLGPLCCSYKLMLPHTTSLDVSLLNLQKHAGWPCGFLNLFISIRTN